MSQAKAVIAALCPDCRAQLFVFKEGATPEKTGVRCNNCFDGGDDLQVPQVTVGKTQQQEAPATPPAAEPPKGAAG